MVSSAASQIEATAGDRLRTTLNGVDIPDYAKVQGILIGVVCIWTIIVRFLFASSFGLCPSPSAPGLDFDVFSSQQFILLTPEHRGAEFEKADAAFVAGSGVRHREGRKSIGSNADLEKADVAQVEKA